MPQFRDDSDPHRQHSSALERLIDDLEHQDRTGRREPGIASSIGDRANLAASLLSLRTARGLSQKELATLSGVEQADISRIERGSVDPRVSTLLRLLVGLAARLSFELLDEDEMQGHLAQREMAAPAGSASVGAWRFSSTAER